MLDDRVAGLWRLFESADDHHVLLDGTVPRVGNRVEIRTRMVDARGGHDLRAVTQARSKCAAGVLPSG